MENDKSHSGGIWDERKTLWCNHCQDNTPHVRRADTSPLLIGCLLANPWWLLMDRTGYTPKNPARCSICGRAHSGRVVKKRDPEDEAE